MKNFQVYSIFLAFVFACIGLPLFFTGCGTNIPNTCFAYIQTTGTIYNHYVQSDLCKKCTKKDKNNKCTNYNYYSCYDGYVKISYVDNGHNNTCTYKPYEDYDNYLYVENQLDRHYPIGKDSELFINKLDHSSCSLNSLGLKAQTYSGRKTILNCKKTV